jgi:hypothetical protein
MRRVNLTDPETKLDADDPPGHQAEMFRFRKDLGAEDTGASLYAIPSGQSSDSDKVAIWTGRPGEDWAGHPGV